MSALTPVTVPVPVGWQLTVPSLAIAWIAFEAVQLWLTRSWNAEGARPPSLSAFFACAAFLALATASFGEEIASSLLKSLVSAGVSPFFGVDLAAAVDTPTAPSAVAAMMLDATSAGRNRDR